MGEESKRRRGGKACSHPPGTNPTAIFPSLWAPLQHYWHLAFCLERVCWLATSLSWKAGGRISLSSSGMGWLHWVHLLTSLAFPYECTAEYPGSYLTAVTSGTEKHFWATSISYWPDTFHPATSLQLPTGLLVPSLIWRSIILLPTHFVFPINLAVLNNNFSADAWMPKEHTLDGKPNHILSQASSCTLPAI